MPKIKLFFSLVAFLLMSAGLNAARLNPEAHYQEIAAKKYSALIL
jgi:hypothetical protein